MHPLYHELSHLLFRVASILFSVTSITFFTKKIEIHKYEHLRYFQMLKNSYRDKKDVCGLISLWTSLGVKLFDLSAFFVHLFMLISFFVSIYMLLASRDAIEGPGGRDVSIGATDASSRFSRLFYCFIVNINHDRHLNNELKAQTTTLLCVYHNLRIWRKYTGKEITARGFFTSFHLILSAQPQILIMMISPQIY